MLNRPGEDSPSAGVSWSLSPAPSSVVKTQPLPQQPPMSYPTLIDTLDLADLAQTEPRDDDTDIDYYSELDSEYYLTAQEQWEESIKQIEGLVNFVIVPLVGKLLGRRTAHVLWRRFANWYFP